MLTVVGYGVIIVLIASMLAVYTVNSIKGSRREQDFDAGVTAAQAGVDQVVAALRSGTSPTAVGSIGWTAVPGSTDASGNSCQGSGLSGTNLPATCPQYKYQTAVDSSGNVTVYAEGRSRKAAGSNSEVDRAVKVTLRQTDYTDYLYYSEVEAADPADPLAYPRLFYPTGGPGVCGLRTWSATSGGQTRPTACKVPLWRNGDATDGSTVHSNDLIQTQGSPTFDSNVTTEYPGCEAMPSNPTPVCYKSTDGGTPSFGSGKPSYATGSVSPTAVDNLPSTATAAGLSECTYTGPTRIKFVGNTMQVWSPQTQASDNPGKNCGGGVSQNLLDQINAKLSIGIGSLLNLNSVIQLAGLPLDQLTQDITSIASPPTAVSIPQVIYVRNNPNNATAPAPTGLYCLLGKTLGMYGTLDPDPISLVENPEELNNCGAGELYVDGAFNGKSTIGTDGNVTIMSDLYYSNASGTSSPGSDHDGTNQLGVVSNGFVEVWDPIQCTLGLTTCLSLSSLKDGLGHFTPLKAVTDPDIHVEAAIMSTQHAFGVSLPLLQPSAYASLLNGLATASITTPKLDLYGSVYQYYRGALGANLLNLGVGLIGVNGALTLNPNGGTSNVDVGVDHVDLANANINVGYTANYVYDQHLRGTPPPAFPTPSAATWVQDTFAEIPVNQLPSGF
jgi:hypothetical protein